MKYVTVFGSVVLVGVLGVLFLGNPSSEPAWAVPGEVPQTTGDCPEGSFGCVKLFTSSTGCCRSKDCTCSQFDGNCRDAKSPTPSESAESVSKGVCVRRSSDVLEDCCTVEPCGAGEVAICDCRDASCVCSRDGTSYNFIRGILEVVATCGGEKF